MKHQRKHAHVPVTTEKEVEIRGKKWMKSQQTLDGFISVWLSALWTSNAVDVFGVQSKYIFFNGT